MKTLLIILIAISIISLYLTVDFKLGRKKHIATADQQIFPERLSNLQIFTQGTELFEDFFNELRNAQKNIHVLFYICKNDQFGKEFLAILEEKAKAGVEVRLLLDWAGSLAMKKSTIRSLKKANVAFSFANIPTAPFFFYSSQVRNHRKITVIDGQIAYMGGFNVGKEYINLDKKLSPWRDYHLKITGEGVSDLQKQFLLDWQRATKINLLQRKDLFPPLAKGNMLHKFIPTEGIFLEDRFSELINKAEKAISIGSPYFIPSKRILEDLLKALKKGIHVTILVPFEADHILVKEASYPSLRKLLENGANVFQYKKGFYHAKILLVDDHFCDLGTANFDKRSFFINLEINCYIYDPSFVRKVKEILNYDLNDSRRLLIEDLKSVPFFKKLQTGLATLISHFL